MSSNPPRRNYTGDEKMAILREALPEEVSISDVCQKHGITPGMFHEWQKKRFEQGAMRVHNPRPPSMDLPAKKKRPRLAVPLVRTPLGLLHVELLT